MLVKHKNKSTGFFCLRPEELENTSTAVTEWSAGSAYVFGVSHHPTVMAWNVWVPRFIISCEGLPIHHLADAAPQGVHTEDPQLALRWNFADRLTFSLQHFLLGGRIDEYGVHVYGYIFVFFLFVEAVFFTSIFIVKPLSVTLLEKAVVSGTVSNWKRRAEEMQCMIIYMDSVWNDSPQDAAWTSANYHALHILFFLFFYWAVPWD